MDNDLKLAIEGLKKTANDFKQENDQRWDEAKKKGFADPLLTEKVDKLNKSLDAFEDRIKGIETAANRPPAPTPTEAKTEVERAAKKAFTDYMRKNIVTEEGTKAFRDSLPEEFKALSVVNDAEGGYLVRPEVSAEINKKQVESSPMRELATVRTISSDAWEEPANYTNPTNGGWVAEKGSRAVTTGAQFNLLRIPVHEMYAMPTITQKLLDDAALDIEKWHGDEVALQFGRDEANAFFVGDGNGKPLGITQYASGQGFNQVEQVVSGSGSTLTADGLINLQQSLFEAFQANAKFVMRRASFGVIRTLKDSQNRYLWSVGEGRIAEGMPMLLLDKPIAYAADMPAIAGNALAVAYGDFKSYYIIDRIGMRVLRDPYSSKGNVLFYTTKRVGGGVRNFQGIKLQKIST